MAAVEIELAEIHVPTSEGELVGVTAALTFALDGAIGLDVRSTPHAAVNANAAATELRIDRPAGAL